MSLFTPTDQEFRVKSCTILACANSQSHQRLAISVLITSSLEDVHRCHRAIQKTTVAVVVVVVVAVSFALREETSFKRETQTDEIKGHCEDSEICAINIQNVLRE